MVGSCVGMLATGLSALFLITASAAQPSQPAPPRIAVRGNQFFLGDAPVFLNGVNTPWHRWDEFGGGYDHAWWDESFRNLKAAHVNCIRIWIHCDGANSPTTDADGVVHGASDALWADMDDLFKLASTYKVYIMPCLWSFDMAKARATADRYKKLLADPAKVQSYIDTFLLPLVKRYDANPYLLAWETCNEPEWMSENQGVAQSDVIRMHAMLAAAIHENSSAYVTTGSACVKWNGTTPNCVGNFWSNESLQAHHPTHDPKAFFDFYQIHYYPWMDPYFGRPFDHTVSEYGVPDDRPVIVGELPARGDAERYVKLYKNGFDGGMGWTANGVDRNGGLAAMAPALNRFYELYPRLVDPQAQAPAAAGAAGEDRPDGGTDMAHATPVKAVRSGLPDGTIPNCFGVNIHFTGDDPQLDMIAAGGFRLIRMDLVWSRVEKEKGVYDFSGTGYDALSDGCSRRGIQPLYILDYGNRLYEQSGSVSSEEARAGYAAFAEAAARRYSGRGFIYEIWNEPNVKQYWHEEPDPEDYVAMLKAAAPRIRAADPSAAIVAPALSTMDMKWLEGTFKRGLLDDVDGVTVHPYRDVGPETVLAEYDTLKELIAKYAPKGKRVPILSGEWGFASRTWTGEPRSLEMQAAYLVRQFLINIYYGVNMSIWYDWRNDGTSTTNLEHLLGTVDHELNPKPAYLAAKTLNTCLEGCKLKKRLDLGEDDDYAMLLSGPKGDAIAAWTRGEVHEVRIPLPAGKGRLVRMQGEESSTSWDGDGPGLKLSPYPVYLLIGS
jgi:hypothetical protein